MQTQNTSELTFRNPNSGTSSPVTHFDPIIEISRSSNGDNVIIEPGPPPVFSLL